MVSTRNAIMRAMSSREPVRMVSSIKRLLNHTISNPSATRPVPAKIRMAMLVRKPAPATGNGRISFDLVDLLPFADNRDDIGLGLFRGNFVFVQQNFGEGIYSLFAKGFRPFTGKVTQTPS